MVKKQTIPKAMIAIFDEREGRPSTDSRERKIALGNGRIKIAITTMYLRRDVNLDRLVMCNHLSTAISDVKRAVTEKKYVALVLLSASITSVIIGLFLQCEYDLQSDAICKRLAATVRGWVFFFCVFFAHARRRQDKQLSHFFCGRSAGQTRTASSWPHYLEAACMCRWNSLDLTTQNEAPKFQRVACGGSFF